MSNLDFFGPKTHKAPFGALRPALHRIKVVLPHNHVGIVPFPSQEINTPVAEAVKAHVSHGVEGCPHATKALFLALVSHFHPGHSGFLRCEFWNPDTWNGGAGQARGPEYLWTHQETGRDSIGKGVEICPKFSYAF